MRRKGRRTRTGLGPELALRVVGGVRLDVEDVKRVAFIGQMIDRPPQRRFAALWEIDGHSDLLILRHSLFLSFLVFNSEDEDEDDELWLLFLCRVTGLGLSRSEKIFSFSFLAYTLGAQRINIFHLLWNCLYIYLFIFEMLLKRKVYCSCSEENWVYYRYSDSCKL